MNTRPTLASTNARIDALEGKLDTILGAINALNAPKQASAPTQKPKASKPEVKSAKKPALPKIPKGFNVVKYSDKAFLAYGEATRHHAQALKGLGGKFNRGFAVGNEKVAGWIFSSKRVSAEAVAKVLARPTKATK